MQLTSKETLVQRPITKDNYEFCLITPSLSQQSQKKKTPSVSKSQNLTRGDKTRLWS